MSNLDRLVRITALGERVEVPRDPTTPKVPRCVPGCDVRTLPLTPVEGYLLSRIDGITSEGDLALVTGLPSDQVLDALIKLARLGAVTWNGAPDPAAQVEAAQADTKPEPKREPKPPAPPEQPGPSNVTLDRPVRETYTVPPEPGSSRSPALYDPASSTKTSTSRPSRGVGFSTSTTASRS